MKLNWIERWVVNNPVRVLEQRFEIRYLKKWISLNPGFVVLEVGCGRGAGAGLILEEFKPGRVHALDFDLRMLRKADDYLSSVQRERISLLAGDVSRLPVKTASLNAVFGFGVLHHAVDWRSSLAEISRVLKPGGIFVLEEFYPALYQNFITRRILLHPEEDRFSGPDLRQALAKAGLNLTGAIESKWLGILGVAVKMKDLRST
jgi:ubiquinone/menaquinone biosynthesis C-methylase UbiE